MIARLLSPLADSFARPMAWTTLLVGLATWASAVVAQADTIGVAGVFPPGVQRGQSVEVQLRGGGDRWPLEVWVDRPGLEFAAGEEKGHFTVTASDQAQPGVYTLRFYDENGVSPPRPFCVGLLPETVEQEPNDTASTPHAVTLPVVVNGVLGTAGDVDTFAVSLSQGDVLVAAIAAHGTLGSPMDGVLQIVSPDGFVLHHVDDGPGLDPLVAWEAPEDGEFRVRVFAFPSAPNSRIAYAGGEDFVYRLSLTTGPWVHHAQPLAVRQGHDAEVRAFGWNLPDDPFTLALPAEAESDARWRALDALPGGVRLRGLPFAVDVYDSAAEAPLEVEPPTAISGTITQAGEVHRYRIAVAKDTKYSFTAEAPSLGLPLRPVLEMFDSDGRPLGSNDGLGRNETVSRVTVTPKSDSSMELRVRDRFGHGGWQYGYLLTLEPLAADFALAIDKDHHAVAAGQSLEIPLTITRTEGLSAEIQFSVEGLPEGVSVEVEPSQGEGPTAKQLTLTLKAEPGTRFSGPIRVAGSSGGDKSLTRVVGFEQPHPERLESLWLTVASDP